MWFYYHSRNGFAPLAVRASSRAEADAYIRTNYSDGDFQFVNQGASAPAGYQQEFVGSGGQGGFSPGGANPAAGVGLNLGSTGVTGAGGIAGGLEQRFARPAFQRGLQRQGVNIEGFLSDYFDSLYRPSVGAFDILGAGLRSADPENAFQNYVARTPTGSVRQNATEAFRTIVNPGAAPDAETQDIRARYADPYGQLAGGAPDQGTIDNLISLAQQAAATKFSPFTSRRLLPNAEQVQERFLRGGLSSPFTDFLQKQYGLSGGF